MNKTPFLVLMVTLAITGCATAAPPKPLLPTAVPQNVSRITAIAAMLPAKPTGVGRPITDRAAWDALAKLEGFKKLIREADKINAAPIPVQSDALYLIFSKTGSRDEWQKVAFDRRSRFQTLVLAECATNHGTYIAKITQYVAALCAEKTWVMPAHDRNLANFKGETEYIDLGSSALGWQMATAYWLLGDKLDASTRDLIKNNITRRIIEPFHACYSGKQKPFGWMNVTNNWNAVCLAGAIGAALATVDDRTTRAEFIAAAEKYSKNYLAGFTPDGYCEEGLGYWNYGFGHYVLLAETIRQATAGQLDLLADPGVQEPAAFGRRIEIINGISPAIADCHVYAKPDASLMYYVNRRFNLGLPGYDALDTKITRDINEEMIYCFPNAASLAPAPTTNANYELRTWFKDAGILICRPAENSNCHFGVAIKGGHNAGNHSHIDTGSYTVVVNDKCLILDPGGERYTARTFSSHRFESKFLNSYGHDVPMVAGQLEREGSDARAVVVKTDFTDTTDTLVLDLTSCYAVPDLLKLERTFIYSRQGAGSLTVTDHATFKTPQKFSTAFITLGKYAAVTSDHLIIEDNTQSANVTVQASGPTKIAAEIIHEDTPNQPTRIGIAAGQKGHRRPHYADDRPIIIANLGIGSV